MVFIFWVSASDESIFNVIVIESNRGLIESVVWFSRKKYLHFPVYWDQDWLSFSIGKLIYNIFPSHHSILLQKIYLYHELSTKGKYQHQKFYILMLFHQEDYLWKLKIRGPKTDPYGTPEFNFLHLDIWPLNTTFSSQLSR